jgi:PqqD family protein of HPr-rel-A system
MHEICVNKLDNPIAMQIKRNIAVSETGFVFDPTSGESYSINAEGQEIVALLKEDKTPEEISSIMCSEYEIDPASFEKYFYDFIGMLRQFQLIEEDE